MLVIRTKKGKQTPNNLDQTRTRTTVGERFLLLRQHRTHQPHHSNVERIIVNK